MKIKKLRESERTNSAMEVMLVNDLVQEEPYVGCFWYDPINNELFGVNKTLHCDVPYYHSNQFNNNVRTGRALHKNIWQKEFYRAKDKRFLGNYTLVPRGRVFEFENDGFYVFVGNWVNEYPQAKQEIIDEFQLPENANFVVDSHWDIGHGWSDDYM